MNKRNMAAVAAFIEQENSKTCSIDKVDFNMYHWVDGNSMRPLKDTVADNWCGTTACIGGTANLIQATRLYQKDKKGLGKSTLYKLMDRVDLNAQKFLGLTDEEELELFYAERLNRKIGGSDGFGYINERQRLVPNALRWMIDNGRIDWLDALTAAEESEACARRPKRKRKTPVHSPA